MTRHPFSASILGRGRGPALLGAAGLLTLTACGDGSPQSLPTVTVTATTPATASATTSAPEEGDVQGRRHDVGTIVDVNEVAGQTVLSLDRWTVVGLDDGVLARDGVPVVPYSGERYANQNSERTYAVPVAPEATLVVNECQPSATAGGVPGLTSQIGDLEDFLAQPGLEGQVVLLTYSDGELVQLDTDPRCD